MPKIESTLQFYKSKYDELITLQEKIRVIEDLSDKQNTKINELNRLNSNVNRNIETYKEKLNEEKDKSINLQLEISKKNIEFDNLFQEKIELENVLFKKEEKISNLQRKIEEMRNEEESYYNKNVDNKSTTLQNDFDDIVKNLEVKFQTQILELESQKNVKYEL